MAESAKPKVGNKEVLELYKKASELGYADTSRALALCYRGKDSHLSFYWYRVGEEQGDSESQLCYARELFHGNDDLDISPQREEAVIWYRKSAEQGNRIAQYALSKCLFYGEGIEKNEAEAFEWCEKAAQQNMSRAQETLSIMYGRGLSTKQDSSKCEYWYRTANRSDSTESYFAHTKMLSDSYPVLYPEFEW